MGIILKELEDLAAEKTRLFCENLDFDKKLVEIKFLLQSIETAAKYNDIEGVKQFVALAIEKAGA